MENSSHRLDVGTWNFNVSIKLNNIVYKGAGQDSLKKQARNLAYKSLLNIVFDQPRKNDSVGEEMEAGPGIQTVETVSPPRLPFLSQEDSGKELRLKPNQMERPPGQIALKRHRKFKSELFS